MTAALYFLPPGTLAFATVGDVVVLDGEEGHHAVTVKRAEVGEELLVADGSGRVATGRVVETGAGSARLHLVALEDALPAGARFVLVQALAKGGRDEQAVEAATELGVDAVVAWQARRCIVRWRPERAEKSLAKWRSVAAAAAKQARRPTAPEVDGALSSEDVARLVSASALTVVLHEDAGEPLVGIDLPDEGDVYVVVGPEGGITPEELALFEEAGACTVRLGPTVLRSSSAGPAALAVLNAAGRWR